jgi:hypothetical protein
VPISLRGSETTEAISRFTERLPRFLRSLAMTGTVSPLTNKTIEELEIKVTERVDEKIEFADYVYTRVSSDEENTQHPGPYFSRPPTLDTLTRKEGGS